jgi:electron transfer flavoprotein beta subunit
VSYNIIVLVKQVPDTKNISVDAMKPDGTVNRSALPTIFNPEDLNALEEALRIKDKYGAKITVLTMGPPNAADVLRQSLFLGADDVILLSDRKFAAADTLATSYALSLAIKKIGDFDLIIGGRQAIDGDTAQVGPQTAEKLNINQATCVDKIVNLSDGNITVNRTTDHGFETIKSKLPILLTITAEANTPRPFSVKKTLTYKNAISLIEQHDYDEKYLNSNDKNKPFIITNWDHEDIKAQTEKCGLLGSPTQVKKIENIVLEAGESKEIENSDDGLRSLIVELMSEHIIG